LDIAYLIFVTNFTSISDKKHYGILMENRKWLDPIKYGSKLNLNS